MGGGVVSDWKIRLSGSQRSQTGGLLLCRRGGSELLIDVRVHECVKGCKTRWYERHVMEARAGGVNRRESDIYLPNLIRQAVHWPG